LTVTVWTNTSFLDLTGYGIIAPGATVTTAYDLTGTPTTASGNVTVALVLGRTTTSGATDPATLLAQNWALREQTLAGMTPAQVGVAYGADPAQFNALQTYLGTTVLGAAQGYVSSAASRTVWVTLNAGAFNTLFGQTLLNPASGSPNSSMAFWNGNLTPNSNLANLAGMWVVGAPQPPEATLDSTPVSLTDGPQGVGNTAGSGYQVANTSYSPQSATPNTVAAQYNFPLTNTNATIATPTVGLIETGGGISVAPGGDPNALLTQYRATVGVTGTGTLSAGPVEQATSVPSGGERSLDIGIIAAAAPNSNIVAYGGAGDVFSTMQEAIWGGGAKIADLSSSFAEADRSSPNSPFYAAYQALYMDAALNNISVFESSGDGGSSYKIATGLPQTDPSHDSTYALVVGGTSISSQKQVGAAGAATTDGGPNINAGIATLAAAAVAGNVTALEILAAGGLTTMPVSGGDIKDFIQTVWNQYGYNASTSTLSSYSQNQTSTGGVDPNVPTPSYQTNYGIDVAALQAANGITGTAYGGGAVPTGKGVPDVSSLAGGNSEYVVPNPDLSGTHTDGGTSAAAPLWAALTAQIQGVFADTGLPSTGYFNDLIYQAAAILPASFNDIRYGSNTSSYAISASGTVTDGGQAIIPTGLGYAAAPGYDLASGLGTPDGILLARTLLQIAETQTYGGTARPVSDATGLTSQAAQLLIVQPTLASGFSGTLTAAGTTYTPATAGSTTAWSASLGEQVLQSYFDPALVTALDRQAHATPKQISVTNGQSLAVTIGATAATPSGQADTTAYGFVNDVAGANAVTLARPFAIASTPGGANNTTAILRIRSDTSDTDVLSIYKVDDLAGSITGTLPGVSGYSSKIAARLVTFAGGGTTVTAPGSNGFLQTTVSGINNGDILAFRLQDQTAGQVIYGIAAQNAGSTDRLWSYGDDTWGFDDASNSFDGDFNDLVFQLDFTSRAGSALLANDAPCFAAGTLIDTTGGQVAVEDLRAGMEVFCESGRIAPIRWIGHRVVAPSRHPRPLAVTPIRVRASAFDKGLPLRDLVLSPDHALYIDGVLVPVQRLVNDTTVRRECVDRIVYYHVELDRHAILYAEGMAAESYLDTGNRDAFDNAMLTAIRPDFSPRDRAAWDTLACAELVEDGERLEAIRARLAARLAVLGIEQPPEFGVTLGGVGRIGVEVPAGTTRVRLRSRNLVPQGESRRLGAAIVRLAIDDVAVALDAATFADGFHAIEEGFMRWTNGTALVWLDPAPLARHLEIDVCRLVEAAAA